jgi:sortase A
MKIVIATESIVWIRRAPRIIFAIAILLLGYSGFVLGDTWVFQHRANARLGQLLRDEPGTRSRQAGMAQVILPVAAAVAVKDGLIGRIEISRLGLSVMVMEGDGEVTLRRAAGHIAGTALPGQPGNVGIAGHRDSFFRPLRNIRDGDVITLTTPGGEFRYRVVSTWIVRPDDVSVLDSDGREVLTLVTCYPFYFVGPAPDRFIVRADRID